MAEDGSPSPFDHLVRFPDLSSKPDGLVLQVLLAYVVHLLGSHDPVALSRRQVADVFNRSDDARLGDYLRRLCLECWLWIAVRSVGADAHMYRRGSRLTGDPDLCEAWDQVALALFGPLGLLTRFEGSSAFGVGMPKESGLVCLGALADSSGPATRRQVTAYLKPFMSRSTVVNSLNRLIRFDLVEETDGLLTVAPNWEDRLNALGRKRPEGNQRQTRGRVRRRKEQTLFRRQQDWGDISDLELVELRKLPCVQCRQQPIPPEDFQMEHFPPRSLLRRRKVLGYNHPFVLSAICRSCNNQMSGFVRSAAQADDRRGDPPPIDFHFGPPGTNQAPPEDIEGFFARLFSASVDFRSRRFYEAFDQSKEFETRSGLELGLRGRPGGRTRWISSGAARSKALRAAAPLADLFKHLEVNGWLKKGQDSRRRWPLPRRFKRGRKRKREKPSRLPY